MVFGFKAVVSYEKLQPKWWFSDRFFPDFLKQLLLCIVLVYLSFFFKTCVTFHRRCFLLEEYFWRRRCEEDPHGQFGHHGCQQGSKELVGLLVGLVDPAIFGEKVVENSEFAKNFWADLKNNSTIKECKEPQDMSRKFLLNHPWTVSNSNPKTPNINKTTKHWNLIRCLLGERFNHDWRVDFQPYTIPKTVLLSEILCIVILKIQMVGIKIQVRKGLHINIFTLIY